MNAKLEAMRETLSRRRLLGCGIGLGVGIGALGFGLAPAGPARAQAQTGVQPYPLADFFQPSRTRGVVLSPSGLRIATLEQFGTPDAPVGAIDIIDAADPEGQRRRINLGPVQVDSFEWANDRRLLVRATIPLKIRNRAPIGSNMRPADTELTSRRVLSVDVEEAKTVVLFEGQRNRMRETLDLGRVVDILPKEPDFVLMTAWERDGVLGMHRVNVNDGSAQRIERGNSGTFGWETQDGVAVLRHDINARGSMETLYARAPGETEWKFVRRTRVVDAPDFSWVGDTERPGVVLVTARIGDEDVEAVREMDVRNLTFGPPMAARPGRDVLYGLKDSAGLYIGAAYYGDRLEYDFTEPALAAHHRALNKFFDDDCDVYLTDVDTARNRFIAYTVGPREPGAWYFYDRTMRKIAHLGSRKGLNTERLANAQTLKVKTRDGAEIEAYLTAPPGGRSGPLVVLPHGGPELRDRREWDPQVQALAAQGWWVLQPNFRGSGGYGIDFAKQGWRRWGERMQEDIEDALAQAIALRGLDASRVAIMGTSYGGYAALMGAVRRPELYKAAISICGVGDLPDMLAWEKREDDTPGQEIYDFWTKRIGVPGTDDPMLAAASPRRRVSEIACPVLLVHGTDDKIVPVIQSRRMNTALRDAGKQVDYVEVSDAGHADWKLDKERELMTRYVALLSKAFA